MLVPEIAIGLKRRIRSFNGRSLRLLTWFNKKNNKKRRKDILRMDKVVSWWHMGLLNVWQHHGYLRMLLVCGTLVRLLLPALPQ